jgi:HAD superfamily hydrolase (TIGR01549 family)
MQMVAFDLDGTLVDQADAAARWAEEFIGSHHHLGLDVVEVTSALTARRPKGEVFAEVIEAHGLKLDVDEVWASYRRRMPQLVSCTDADRDALVELRTAGWRLGIVTNGMVDNQQGKIRQLGLDALVDGWVISDEVGVRKPARGIFEALATRLECPLDGWMVGDSLELDIAGGRAVGLRTALVTSEPVDHIEGVADLVVASVAEAAAFILAEER